MEMDQMSNSPSLGAKHCGKCRTEGWIPPHETFISLQPCFAFLFLFLHEPHSSLDGWMEWMNEVLHCWTLWPFTLTHRSARRVEHCERQNHISSSVNGVGSAKRPVVDPTKERTREHLPLTVEKTCLPLLFFCFFVPNNKEGVRTLWKVQEALNGSLWRIRWETWS